MVKRRCSKKRTSTKVKIAAARFDCAFDRGGGFDALDLESATVHSPMQRINLDLPKQLLHQIDNEANRIGVPRTSVIKLWISEKLSELKVV